MRTLIIICLFLCSPVLYSQTKIVLHPDRAETKINKHIYGHFAEHLGRCIYGGFYVGDDQNDIPHTEGVRNDLIEALKNLKIPNLRWPGGCFADTYHWKDAVGLKEERKHIENLSWGNIRENNAFGTNEFLNLCETLGAEPYLAVNMNTGTVQEAVEWVQYTNHANGSGHLADLRRESGRNRPWNVNYWGIGNESWDCGGSMSVDHYINLYKQYATAMTSYSNSEKLFRIAVGPGHAGQYNWMEELMKNIPARRFEGVSIHHYSVIDWSKKGSSFDFTDEEYFTTLSKALFMDEFITQNSRIMDKYDPARRVALIVDEWGGWYDTDPEGAGELYQQNTIRDAMIAGLTLNIFNNHADRVRMANLAQTVNVLQAVILTRGNQLILTPTYHVMEMYKLHQDATLVPMEILSSEFVMNGKHIPSVSVSASLDTLGKMHISLTHLANTRSEAVEIDLKEFRTSGISGRILSSAKVQDGNTFDYPNRVRPGIFADFSFSKNKVLVQMPPNSVVVLELNP